jgi:hypothetical protein
MGFADPGAETPLFYRRLASLSAAPLLTKHIIPGNGGLNEPEDNILTGSPICHDDLFA